MVACGILDSMRLNPNASKPLFCRVKLKCDGICLSENGAGLDAQKTHSTPMAMR